MEFIGVIGFDGGDNNMESRHTIPTSFGSISDWFNSVVEFYQGEMRYSIDTPWREISVMVYVHDETYSTIHAEPIETIRIRRSLNS